jgi:hypothetical protein
VVSVEGILVYAGFLLFVLLVIPVLLWWLLGRGGW